MNIHFFTGEKRETSFRPVVLVEQVTNFIINAIIDDVFKGGDRLIETKLQKQYGISRSPLREAFRELEKRGFVEIIPRKGTFVKKISLKTIEDTFPVRTSLEVLAAKLACEKISGQSLSRMEEAFDSMKASAERNDAKSFWQNHFLYHEIVIEACENQVLIGILNVIRMQTLWHRFYFQYHQEGFEKSLSIHRHILDLFHEKPIRTEKVEAAIRDHLARGNRRFVKYLKEQTSKKNNK